MLESDAVVDGLEQSARGRGDPVGRRLRFADGDGGHAPAHDGRADAAPFHGIDPGRRDDAAGGALGHRQQFALLQRADPGFEILDLFLNVLDLLIAIGGALARGGEIDDAEEQQAEQCGAAEVACANHGEVTKKSG
jgi:hypothetical protein